MTENLRPQEPQIGQGQPGAALLREADRIQSARDDFRHYLKTASFTGTDEANTVKVTVAGDLRLTGLDIQHGLLRLGAEAVGQRVNEAYRNARAAATETVGGEQEKLLETLGLTAEIMEQLDSAVEKFTAGPGLI